jgi:hypothetical protein
MLSSRSFQATPAQLGRRWLILAAVAWLSIAGFDRAFGQSGTSGTIQGTVKDASGGALPGVMVTLTSPVLQIRQLVAITDPVGDYRLVDLPSGSYRLTYELSGFSTLVRDDFRLPVGFVARVDVVMKVGGVEESVTVSGQSPVVDVTTTAASVNFTTETLNELPRGRDLAFVYSMAPGVTMAGVPDVGGSSMADRQNIGGDGVFAQPKLQVEGMDITLGNELNSGVYFNSDTVEEIQIKTSGNDAEVSVPGISMVAVIKSGGDSFHGNYNATDQPRQLQSNNLDAHLRSQGLSATQPLKKFYDLSADLGGRIARDKLWFYGAYSRQDKTTGLLGFVSGPDPKGCYLCVDAPLADYHASLSQFAAKLSYQASKNNRFNYVWQRGTKIQKEDGAGRFYPLETTRDYYNPSAINRGEFQGTINNRSLVNIVAGRVAVWSDHSALRAGREAGPSRLDRETRLHTGANDIPEYERPRTRWMLDAAYTLFPQSFLGGHHEFKTGLTYYRDSEGYWYPGSAIGNYVLVTDKVNGVSGTPVQIQVSNWPVKPTDRQDTYAWYLKDTWRITSALTANFGVRWEYQHLFLPPQTKPASPDFPTLFPAGSFPYINLYTWTRTVPRAGLAWSLSSKSVIKTTFGLYNYMIGEAFAGTYNRNATGGATFTWHDSDGDRLYQPGEVNLDPNGPDFVNITGASNNLVNPNLKEPRTLEYSLGYERELAANLGFRAQYVFRRLNDYYDTPGPNTLRPASAYTIPITRRDPGPDGNLGTADDGGKVTFYDYAPAYAGAKFVANMVTNSPHADRFHSIEWTLTRRSSGRWMGTLSYFVTKNHRWLTHSFDNPNNLVFPIDETWGWAGNATVSYRMAGDVMLAAFLQSRQGVGGARTVLFRTADPDGGTPISQLSTVTLRMEPYGIQRGAAENILNLRGSKDFRFGSRKVSFDIDCFNALNSNAATGLVFESGPTFGYANGVLPARIFRLGARFAF